MISYSPKISVYLEGLDEKSLNEVKGMLRGLFHAIEGWEKKPGVDPDRFFASMPMVIQFSSVERAHYFKECAERYCSPELLAQMEIKKRVYRDK